MIYAVRWNRDRIRIHHQVNELFLEQRRTGEPTHRNGLVEISRPRNTIMIEELGWGAQCAEAGFLRSVGRGRASDTFVRGSSALLYFSFIFDRMHILGTI